MAFEQKRVVTDAELDRLLAERAARNEVAGREPVPEPIGEVDPAVMAAIERQRAKDAERSLDPQFLQSVFARFSSVGGGAPPPMPRRYWSFIMDAAACTPGVFDRDFEITCGALTPDLELRA